MTKLGINIIELFFLLAVAKALAVEAPPLDQFRRADRIWVAVAEGQLQPKQKVDFQIPADSYISFKKGHGELVKAGETWALLDEDTLRFEAEALELKRLETQRSVRQLEKQEKERKVELHQKIRDCQRKLAELELALEDTRLPQDLKQRLDEAKGPLMAKKEQLEEEGHPDSMAAERDFQQRQLELSLHRQEESFERLKRRSTLRAEFDGTLHIHLEGAQDPELLARPHFVRQAGIIATLQDDSVHQLSFVARTGALAAPKRESLVAAIEKVDEMGLFFAEFDHLEKQSRRGKVERILHFKIPNSERKFALAHTGETFNSLIYRLLPEPAYIVPKTKLAPLAPKILGAGGWQALVEALYPGSRLIYVAPRSLAITTEE